MAESAAFKPAPESSDRIAAAPRADEPPASAQTRRPRPAGGLLRPSQVPVPGDTTSRTGSPSPAGGRAHHGLQRLRPSGAPAGAALPLARPSTVPARPVQDVLRGSGQPLAAPLQEEMQARLGADFSDVRVHTDAAARASAAQVGAHAYTSGSHVVIGDGAADKHTLAHELTHVIQQRQGPVAGTDHGSGFKVSDPFDAYEKAAEANAARVMARAPGPVQRSADRPIGGSGAPVIQRVLDPAAFEAFLESSGQFNDVFHAIGEYYNEDVPTDGYSEENLAAARTVLNQVAQQQAAQDEIAQDEIAQRRQNFVSNSPDEWVLSRNIRYGSKAPATAFDASDDAALERIAIGELRPREKGYGINFPLHQHLAGGSHGVAFVYVVEQDWRVGILVYACSSARQGNKYKWASYGSTFRDGPPPVPSEEGDQTENTAIGESRRLVAQRGQGGSSSSS